MDRRLKMANDYFGTNDLSFEELAERKCCPIPFNNCLGQNCRYCLELYFDRLEDMLIGLSILKDD